MKTIWHSAFLGAIVFGLYACSDKVKKPLSNAVYAFVDTANYEIDTSYNQVLLDSQKLNIVLFRPKMNEHLQPFDSNLASPVTLAISSDSSQRPIYLKSFETDPDDYPYTVPAIFKANGAGLHTPGHLFFSLDKGYGGSGSSYLLYWIKNSKKTVQLIPIVKSKGELSYTYFFDQGKGILLFEAIWNMEQGEAHFSDHRIQLTKIDLSKNQPVYQLLGVTKHQYQLPDKDSSARVLVAQIRGKEPQFSGLPDF